MIESKVIAESRNIELIFEDKHVPISSEQIKQVNILWNSETKNNSHLFNGKALIYSSHYENENKLIIKTGWSYYKYIFVSLLHPELKLNICPIAVSGMIIDNSLNSIIGKRAKSTTQYPSHYEFVPSGGIKPDKVKEDRTVDFKVQLIEEFEQETGLKRKGIEHISPLGLIFEPHYRVYVIACALKLNTILSSDILKINKKEYSSLKIMSLKDLDENVLRKYNFVPTSRTIIHNLFNSSETF